MAITVEAIVENGLLRPMQQHGLTRLASHDADSDRVPVLTRFAPA